MNTPMTGLLACGFLMSAGIAQIVVPANPGKFKGRSTGSNTSGGVQIIPKEAEPARNVRYTTYITLSVSRFWTSTEGKLLEAKLIAFEDLTVEGVQGAPPPAAPEPPQHPTVTRNGKIRLLVNRKPVELALSRLCPADQEFVTQVQTAYGSEPK